MMSGNKEVPEEEKVRNKDYTVYEEGIYVGYRHFDKAKLDVSYPFGDRLSYTDFEFNNMEVAIENDTVKFKVEVQNVGEQIGKEVVQVYVSIP